MKKTVQIKKDDLFKKRQGVVESSEPKFLWLKMIDWVRGYHKVLTVRKKFNDAMENVLVYKRSHYILDVNLKINDASYFTDLNALNGDGRVCFWIETDQLLEQFTRDKDKFIPEMAMMRPLPQPPKPATPSHTDYHTSFQPSRFYNKPRYGNKVWINKKFFPK